MENEPKKISFGFNKLVKKSNIFASKEQPKEKTSTVQLIEYLEGQAIKVVGGDENKEKAPLVIPMRQPNKKLVNLVDIVKNDFKDSVNETTDSNKTIEPSKVEDQSIKTSESSLTLEELAAKELLNELKSNEPKEGPKTVIQVPNPEKPQFEGEKESTIDDYDNVPITEFGKAMLRGMGWKDGLGIGKNQQLVKMAQPIIRPKGMGLGADKMTKQGSDAKPAVDREGKVLKCVKGAFIKVTAGYHKGNYGQIIGFDDESGRFIIKLTLNNLNVSLNEFLVTPVTREDYNKNSKVINNAKYDEYIKKKEMLEQSKSNVGASDSKSVSRSEKHVKNEPTSDSEAESSRHKSDKRRVKKERKSESDDDRKSYDKQRIKKEIKSDENNSDEDRETRHKEKYNKVNIKKEKKSDDSDSETEKTSSRKSEKSSRRSSRKDKRYESEDDDKEERRDRQRREKDKKRNKSRNKDTDSDYDKKKRQSSKYDSDDSSNEYEVKSKKKHKKKKSKRHSSDESSDEEYRRKSKKNGNKKRDDSESNSEDKHRKSHKKDKKRDKEKRERSRHEREDIK